MKRRAAFLTGTAALSTVLLALPAASQTELTRTQAYQLTLKVKNDAVALAERQCLASTEQTRERSIGLIGQISGAIRSMFGGVTARDRQRVVRGAIDAPSTVYLAANGQIRDCIARYLPAIEQRLLEESRVGAPGAATGGFPGAIDVRFTYRRSDSLDPHRYSDNLRVNLREPGRPPVDANIASQSGQDGSPFFFYTYFPFPKGQVHGTISAKPIDSRLTADQVPRSTICFERTAAPLPAPLPSGADMFDCTEGGTCKPAGSTRRWLRPCGGAVSMLGRARDWFAALSPIRTAHAQSGAVRWVTPSIDTLVSHPGAPVGYSYFKIKTDAFKRPDVEAVEVGIAVNGVRVDEDGLAPAERPVPNDPQFSFDYLFALQTLNFEGREGGCDVVTLTLTPQFENGRKGEARSFRLSYGALRDMPERTEKSGDMTLNWSAAIIRPMREWRHIAFIHSYPFRYGDIANQRDAKVQAEQGKAVIDGMGWTMEGEQVRAVIRPPLTLTNGTGYYGLAVGLAQPTGQIRFTFSEAQARAIGNWMVARRAGNARAAQVIDRNPYLYQARSGGVTPDGICPFA
jgi:hypothetical protein